MAKKKRPEREAAKRRAEFIASHRRLVRRRNVIGLLAFVPLTLALGCGAGAPLDLLCALPRDVLLLVWAGLFGSFLGLTIRLILERRRFERGEASGGRSA